MEYELQYTGTPEALDDLLGKLSDMAIRSGGAFDVNLSDMDEDPEDPGVVEMHATFNLAFRDGPTPPPDVDEPRIDQIAEAIQGEPAAWIWLVAHDIFEAWERMDDDGLRQFCQDRGINPDVLKGVLPWD